MRDADEHKNTRRLAWRRVNEYFTAGIKRQEDTERVGQDMGNVKLAESGL